LGWAVFSPCPDFCAARRFGRQPARPTGRRR
jgi:hypothetical protein